MSDESFAALLREKKYEQLFSRRGSFRAHWQQLVRLLLSVSAKQIDAKKWRICWENVTPKALEEPVSVEVLRAWLKTKPHDLLVAHLAHLFSPQDEQSVSMKEWIELLAEEAPLQLINAFPRHHTHDPLEQALPQLAGETLGHVCGKYAGAHASLMLRASTDAIVVYLRSLGERQHCWEIEELGAELLRRKAGSDPRVRRAYGDALVSCFRPLRNTDFSWLRMHGELLEQEAIEGILEALLEQKSALARVVFRVVSNGRSEGARALVSFLTKHPGERQCFVALASMGSVGTAAVQEKLQKELLLDERASDGFSKLLSLPEAPSVWLGAQLSMPRFGRNWQDEHSLWTRFEDVSTHPVSLETLLRVLQEPLEPSSLSSSGWADLLQVWSLDPSLGDVSYAWHRAMKEELLGRGVHSFTMKNALDRMAWNSTTTRSAKVENISPWELLLWAGASREVYLYAIGCCLRCRFDRMVLHESEESLRRNSPTWAPEVLAVLLHHRSERHESMLLGPPPLVALWEGSKTVVELETPTQDLWIDAEIHGAERCIVRFCGGLELQVDVREERWHCTAGGGGVTPPLLPERVRVSVETVRDVVAVGVDGAILPPVMQEISRGNGSVRVEVLGAKAAVTKVELRRKYSIASAEAVAAVLDRSSSVEPYERLLAFESESVARFLAAGAVFWRDQSAALARRSLEQMDASRFASWQRWVAEHAREEERASVAIAFAVRSFEAVVWDFEQMIRAQKKRASLRLTRGAGPSASMEFASMGRIVGRSDRDALPAVSRPAVYLGNNAPAFGDVQAFVYEAVRLPALYLAGESVCAKVTIFEQPEEFLLTRFDSYQPDLGSGPLEQRAWVASWRVLEGWAWAVLSVESPLETLVGIAALPPFSQWLVHEEVHLG